MPIQVRVANPEDAPAVRRVLEGSYPQLMSRSYDPALLARALPLITQPNPKLLSSGSYYVAELNGGIVGCGGWSEELPGAVGVEPALGHVRHFATMAAATGLGVGRAIFAACEASARIAEVTRFECQASLNAELFYVALGFRRVEAIGVQMAPDIVFPSIRMTREI